MKLTIYFSADSTGGWRQSYSESGISIFCFMWGD